MGVLYAFVFASVVAWLRAPTTTGLFFRFNESGSALFDDVSTLNSRFASLSFNAIVSSSAPSTTCVVDVGAIFSDRDLLFCAWHGVYGFSSMHAASGHRCPQAKFLLSYGHMVMPYACSTNDTAIGNVIADVLWECYFYDFIMERVLPASCRCAQSFVGTFLPLWAHSDVWGYPWDHMQLYTYGANFGYFSSADRSRECCFYDSLMESVFPAFCGCAQNCTGTFLPFWAHSGMWVDPWVYVLKVTYGADFTYFSTVNVSWKCCFYHSPIMVMLGSRWWLFDLHANAFALVHRGVATAAIASDAKNSMTGFSFSPVAGKGETRFPFFSPVAGEGETRFPFFGGRDFVVPLFSFFGGSFSAEAGAAFLVPVQSRLFWSGLFFSWHFPLGGGGGGFLDSPFLGTSIFYFLGGFDGSLELFPPVYPAWAVAGVAAPVVSAAEGGGDGEGAGGEAAPGPGPSPAVPYAESEPDDVEDEPDEYDDDYGDGEDDVEDASTVQHYQLCSRCGLPLHLDPEEGGCMCAAAACDECLPEEDESVVLNWCPQDELSEGCGESALVSCADWRQLVRLGVRSGRRGWLARAVYPWLSWFGLFTFLVGFVRLGARAVAGSVCRSAGWWSRLLCLLVVVSLPSVAGVTCLTCHDQISGCVGGAQCPFHETPWLNTQVLSSGTATIAAVAATATAAAVAARTITSVGCDKLLPRSVMRVMTRSVLDFFMTVSRRPNANAAVDVSALDAVGLATAVNDGSVHVSDAMAEGLRRQATSTVQAEVARWSAIVSTLANMEKIGAHIGTAGLKSSGGDLLGCFTLAWVQAGRVVTMSASSVALAGQAQAAASDGGRSSLLQAKIIRPTSMAQFSHMLTVWTLICQATGVGNALLTNAFVLKVVHEQMAFQSLSWQEAHELFLVYLEAVEVSPLSGNELTLANVYESGGQDMYRERAAQRAKDNFKVGKQPPDEGGQQIFRKWNGSFTGSAKPCLTFNLGRKDHPAGALDDRGCCKFAHKCDHWVSDKGAGGICGSTRHKRGDCDNPAKCDQRVDR
jgi:hypothetical protein